MVPSLRGIHHLELWVEDAEHTARHWIDTFGYSLLATADPARHALGCHSVVLAQGEVRIVITAATADPRSKPVRAHVTRHGDGVRDVCFATASVSDIESAGRRRDGTRMVQRSDIDGTISELVIPVYGETVHSLWYVDDYDGIWAPGYDEPTNGRTDDSCGVAGLDHVNCVLAVGETPRWVAFYEDRLGFYPTQRFDPTELAAEDSAVMNLVVGDGSGRIKLPMTEPSPLRPGHVGTFLEANSGPGIQHLALACDDIFATVGAMRERGVRFMTTRAGYYEHNAERFEALGLGLDELAQLGILADTDDEGSLLQVFSMPIVDRPTLFLEIIERRGCRGFGAENIKWLAKSAEDALGSPMSVHAQ